MKKRKGFVSNSSSTSFIVIDNNTDLEKYKHHNEKLLAGKTIGETGFGWDPRDYYDIGSKINFCYLQVLYQKDEEERYSDTEVGKRQGRADKWLKMLEEVILENSNITKINWNNIELRTSNMGNYSYIDHASSVGENANYEMFDSTEELKSFIFNDNSYIHTDNDNDY